MVSEIRGANNLILEEIWKGASSAAKDGMYTYIKVYIHLFIHMDVHI
jgi:hypothetical protein